MTGIGTITLCIIVGNLIFSYKGLTNHLFFDGYKFQVDKILINKDYKRLITSGFLHVGWTHLIFNMISLYAFSGVEYYLGGARYLLLYFSGLLGGNLFSLLIHKQHGDYDSAGASGAVCGVIFASIALFPGFEIGFFGIPASIPGWLYGVIYVVYSIYGIRSKRDNIGHEAHLGGALVGLAVAILMEPSALTENYFPIAIITLPCIFFICMIIRKPQFLLIDNYFFKKHYSSFSIDQRYNLEKVKKQKEVDRILEKIHNKGIKSLTGKEKQILDEYSKTIDK